MEEHGTDRPQVLITPTLLLAIAKSSEPLNFLARPATRWSLIGVHALLLVALLLHFGVLVDKEALKYLGCAQDVLEGDYEDLTGNYLKYGAYVLFLVPFVAIGAPWLAVFAQVVIGVLAAMALGRMVRRVSGSKRIGNLTMALLLVCWPVQFWVLALYTESFFTSMVILFMERITRDGRADAWVYLLGLITVFARPVGFLFVGPAVLWHFSRSMIPILRWSFLVVGSLVILGIAVVLPGIQRAQLAPIAEGQVIAGGSEGSEAMEAFTGSSIADAQLYFIGKHTKAEWVKLTIRRMVSLYTIQRPWYSTFHNVVSSAWYLLYPIALYGLWYRRSHGTIQLIITVLALNTALIGLTHDEWSGRFLVPLLPWVILLAASGMPRPRPIPSSDQAGP